MTDEEDAPFWWTPEKLKLASEMMESGMSRKAVARHFNRDKSSLRAALIRSGLYKPQPSHQEMKARIELLESALRTIDNMIPKDSPNLPIMAMVAGDIAEGALNGTWPAFGVLPRVALKEKKDD